jgi:hypothetical protein
LENSVKDISTLNLETESGLEEKVLLTNKNCELWNNDLYFVKVITTFEFTLGRHYNQNNFSWNSL